jgi:hypothetical protein
LNLLEFLYENGLTHGHINANSLRIGDDFTFTLSDFPLSTVTPNLATMSPDELTTATVGVRGFYKTTASDDFQARLTAGEVDPFFVRELVQEDWKDMVTTFYFPRQSKMLTDPRIRTFIENCNKELLEEGQETG